MVLTDKFLLTMRDISPVRHILGWDFNKKKIIIYKGGRGHDVTPPKIYKKSHIQITFLLKKNVHYPLDSLYTHGPFKADLMPTEPTDIYKILYEGIEVLTVNVSI